MSPLDARALDHRYLQAMLQANHSLWITNTYLLHLAREDRNGSKVGQLMSRRRWLKRDYLRIIREAETLLNLPHRN